jgi:large conductance mechanosensitive channel
VEFYPFKHEDGELIAHFLCNRFSHLRAFHVTKLIIPINNKQEGIMSFMSEFKEFAVKGNAVDLAIGVIIGAAFGKIVSSIVDDLIMPIVGAIFGGLDFSNLFITLGEVPPGVAMTLAEMKKAAVPVFAYGNFLSVLLNFVILALVIFIMVKQINRLKKEAPPPAPAATPEDIQLLREIRDSLKK